jgi:hypothetical protein
MSDLPKLRIWDEPAIRGALSWYLNVAENRRPAKFRIAATLATQLDPAASSEGVLWAELDRLTPIFLDRTAIFTGRRKPISPKPKHRRHALRPFLWPRWRGKLKAFRNRILGIPHRVQYLSATADSGLDARAREALTELAHEAAT